jgi:hypothetical protein
MEMKDNLDKEVQLQDRSHGEHYLQARHDESQCHRTRNICRYLYGLLEHSGVCNNEESCRTWLTLDSRTRERRWSSEAGTAILRKEEAREACRWLVGRKTQRSDLRGIGNKCGKASEFDRW